MRPTKRDLVNLRNEAKGGVDYVKVHIHTFQPGEVYDCLCFGVYAGHKTASLDEMYWIDTVMSWDELNQKYPKYMVMS